MNEKAQTLKCPHCRKEITRCPYCGEMVDPVCFRMTPPPMNTIWDNWAKQHKPNCRHIETRGEPRKK